VRVDGHPVRLLARGGVSVVGATGNTPVVNGRGGTDEAAPRVEDDYDEVCLLLPPRTSHLRAARLVAAEAGGQAGFDRNELDDLRVAVGELCYTLMDATDQRLLLRLLVRGGRVIVRGSAPKRRGAAAPRLAGVSALIVDAVTDHHALAVDGERMSFVLVKSAASAVSA
jgi:hypothetical protein